MTAQNSKPPTPPTRPRRRRSVKWFLASAIPLAIAVAVGLALRPPKVVPTPDNPRIEAHFVDVTDRAGIHFRHVSGATGKKLLPETMGSGVAVLDFDGDGLLDVYLLTFGGPNSASTNKLFRQVSPGKENRSIVFVGSRKS